MPNQAPTADRRRAVLPLAALLVLAVLVVPTGPAGAAALGPKATRLVELLNRERAARGLRELRVLPRLARLASAHSATMGGGDAPCGPPHLHHNPRLSDQVQPASSWGENVACAGDADQMHQALMDSPGHRRNILGAWNAVGVGAYEGRLLWGTQVFATVGADELAAAAPTGDPPADRSPSAAAGRPQTRPPPTVTTAPPAARAKAMVRKTMITRARFDPERDWPAVGRELRRLCPVPRLFGRG
jgi:uncharacterized protein YkwD